jgi:hypothetical protein
MDGRDFPGIGKSLRAGGEIIQYIAFTRCKAVPHPEGRGDNSKPEELEHDPTPERGVFSRASRKRRFFLPAHPLLRDRLVTLGVTQSVPWIY